MQVRRAAPGAVISGVTADAHRISIVRSPWTGALDALISLVDQHLLIASPFATRSAIARLIAALEQRDVCRSVGVAFITDLRPESVLAGSLDLRAFADLGRTVPRFELTHLPSIHAKVYVADCKMAIVTSGNLTEPGLSGNIEYGVGLADPWMVKEVRSDFENYASLGAKVSLDEVASLAAEMSDLEELFRRAQRPVSDHARRVFEAKLKLTRLSVLRHRAKGKTTNAIFSDSIKFLLAKGPLRTEEIHPRVQLLHPDLCDDSIDRVIDGVNFGKRWKHYVRNAQQHLKRAGEIRFEGERWCLV